MLFIVFKCINDKMFDLVLIELYWKLTDIKCIIWGVGGGAIPRRVVMIVGIKEPFQLLNRLGRIVGFKI